VSGCEATAASRFVNGARDRRQRQERKREVVDKKCSGPLQNSKRFGNSVASASIASRDRNGRYWLVGHTA